jgi:hypothetical protein
MKRVRRKVFTTILGNRKVFYSWTDLRNHKKILI